MLLLRAGPRTKTRSSRAWFSPEFRARAATLYEENNFSAAAAGAKLGKDTNGRAPERPDQFCQRQFKKLQQHGSVGNRPIPGRPPKVPQKLVKQLVGSLVQPDDSDGEPVYMESMDHVLQRNPSLKREFQELEASPRTVARAVTAGMEEAGIRFASVKRQRRLTDAQKKARKKFCRKALENGKKRLKATVFVDESSFDLQPKGNAVAAVEVGAEPIPWTDPQTKKRSAITAHWTGAVMHGIGNVGFFLTTGTTWKRSRYKVMLLLTLTTPSTLALLKVGDQVTLAVILGHCTFTRLSKSLMYCNTSVISP
jgi:hypothetical protein